MNYKIITDKEKLLEFIEWLPELKPTEKYYLCLFARSKYTKDEHGVNGIAHIKSDKAQLKRFTSDKQRMFDKIWQLECPIGAYKQRDVIIPQQALALYISTNPRDMWKATPNSLVKLAQCIRDHNHLGNPHQEVLSEIQRTKGTTHYIDFDLDVPSGTILEPDQVKTLVANQVNIDAASILRTRGGYHILIDPKKVHPIFKNSFYRGLSSISGVDQTGDQMIPVPGTYQGGFTPHFINL